MIEQATSINRHGRIRFHIVRRDACGWDGICGTDLDAVAIKQTVPAHTVEQQLRCRKRACQAAFEQADRARAA